MTVAEAKARMSVAEFEDWLHWFEYRADLVESQRTKTPMAEEVEDEIEAMADQVAYDAMLARLDARLTRMSGPPQRN